MQKLPGNDEPVAENKEITPKNNEPVAEDKPITPEIDSPVVGNGTFATSLPDIVAKIFRPKKTEEAPQRWFLPAAFLLVIFGMFFSTYILNIDVFYKEIEKVSDGAAEKDLVWHEAGAALVEHWEERTTEYMALKDRLVELHGWEMNLLDKHFVRDADYSYSVVKDNHDWLQFITFTAQPRQIVQEIETIKELDIPILYVQPPTKFIDGYTEFPDTLNDHSAENVAANFALLDAAEVPYLDLRQAAEEDNLDKERMFYRTDHHWRVETALWAVGRTVQELEELFGWELDPDGAYTDPANWRVTDYGENFLGSQGRRVGPYYAGLDNFCLLTPKFDTKYHLELKQHTGELTIYYGDFITTIINKDLLTEPSVYTNRYGTYWGADYPTVVADNLNIEDGLTVLLVKDSYGLPYGAFLSTMVDKLYMVDLRYYNIDNLPQYIEAADPDVILIMYS